MLERSGMMKGERICMSDAMVTTHRFHVLRSFRHDLSLHMHLYKHCAYTPHVHNGAEAADKQRLWGAAERLDVAGARFEVCCNVIETDLRNRTHTLEQSS